MIHFTMIHANTVLFSKLTENSREENKLYSKTVSDWPTFTFTNTQNMGGLLILHLNLSKKKTAIKIIDNFFLYLFMQTRSSHEILSYVDIETKILHAKSIPI